MTPNEVNAYLWGVLNSMGWWYWSLPVVLALWILLQIYRLHTQASLIGRTARITATLGCILLFASPRFNVAGAVAFPLLMFTLAVLVTQTANRCSAERSAHQERHGTPSRNESSLTLRLARASVIQRTTT